MTSFPVHSLQSAPKASGPALEALQAAFGFLPNIAGAMSTSPVLIGSLVRLFEQVHGGSFSETQIQTLLLTNAVTNGAAWAVAFHSYLGLEEGLTPADVEAIRGGRLPKDAKLAALSGLAGNLIRKRGHVADGEKDAFLAAGFEPGHLLEVVAVVAASTITNYTASVANPPLEPMFRPHAWTAADGAS